MDKLEILIIEALELSKKLNESERIARDDLEFARDNLRHIVDQQEKHHQTVLKLELLWKEMKK